MSSKIILKKSSVASKVPLATDLDYGELALNYADGKIYYKNAANNIASIYTKENSYARYTYTAYEAQTTFAAEYTTGNVDVWLDGFKLVRTVDFDDTNNSSIILTEAATTGSIVEILAFNSFSVANTYTKSEVDGRLGAVGNSAYSNQYSLTGITNSAAETELFVNGTSNYRVNVPLNKITNYTIDIVGRRTDVLGDLVYLTLKGSALNNAGSTTDVGSIYEVIVTRTDANFVADCRANNTTDSINVYVTGAAGKTISWKAVVTTIEL